MGVNVARQQKTLATGLDLQDTGALIAVTGPGPLPQHKAHAIPLPALAADASPGPQHFRQALALSADNLCYRQPPVDRTRAPGVIGMSVADQHQVQPANP
ncbi:hypothetical protein D3C86_2030480 [compost metagenome]